LFITDILLKFKIGPIALFAPLHVLTRWQAARRAQRKQGTTFPTCQQPTSLKEVQGKIVCPPSPFQMMTTKYNVIRLLADDRRDSFGISRNRLAGSDDSTSYANLLLTSNNSPLTFDV
jgi:hypothetical protein